MRKQLLKKRFFLNLTVNELARLILASQQSNDGYLQIESISKFSSKNSIENTSFNNNNNHEKIHIPVMRKTS